MIDLDQGQVLITGCAGFIGSRTTEIALSQGLEVLGVDVLSDYYDVELKKRNLRAIAAHSRESKFKFVEKDVLELEISDLSRASAVIHCAGQPGVRSSWKEFDSYARMNILATHHLLELVIRSEIHRVVYSSSSSVYGNASSYPVVESSPTHPVSPYGVSKLAAEHLCGAYAETFALPVVSLRYFTVYGPRQRPDMAIHRMISACEVGRDFTVFGDGSHIRDFTYVDDVARANLLAATREEIVGGEVLNVCGGTSVLVRDLISEVEDACGKRLLVNFAAEQPGDVRQTGGDNSRAQQKLGWKPEIGIAEGVRREVAWFRSQ